MEYLRFHVTAEFDEEANIWYVAESNIPGLSAEGATPEELYAKVSELLPELIEDNWHEIKRMFQPAWWKLWNRKQSAPRASLSFDLPLQGIPAHWQATPVN